MQHAFLPRCWIETGGRDLVTWPVNRCVPCFSELCLNTEGSIEAVMSHILQTAVLYLRHLLKFNLQWHSHTYACMRWHTGLTCSRLCTVLRTSGGVFFSGETNHVNYRSECVSQTYTNTLYSVWHALPARWSTLSRRTRFTEGISEGKSRQSASDWQKK